MDTNIRTKSTLQDIFSNECDEETVASNKSSIHCEEQIVDSDQSSINCEEIKSIDDLAMQETINAISAKTKDEIFIQSDSSSETLQDNTTPWQNPDYFKSYWQEYAFIITCMLTNLLNQAGQSQILSTMNVLGDAFHTDDNKKTWIMASFPLVSGSFILISGRIGDVYGLKRTLMGGCIGMIIWSLICGFSSYSSNVTFFITARAFQGLGVAFALPNAMGLVGNIYKVGTLRKNIVISFIGMCAPAGAALGSLWAGMITYEDESQWPWIFYAYAIVTFINLCMAYVSIPNTVPTNTNGFSMDWWGSVLAVVGLILFNFVWNQGPIVGWQTGYVIALLIISLLFLIAFFLYEVKYAESPLLPPEVVKNRHIITILVVIFMGWGSFGIWTFYYYAFQLNLRHYSTVWAGGSHAMFILFGTIAAFICAFSIKRVGAPFILFCSAIGFTVGSMLLSITPVHQTYWKMNIGMVAILSFGMDLSFPAASIILSDFLPMQYQGMAGSLVNTIINYSTSLCLGMGTTVERQINKSGEDTLKGYRAALYCGIGLGGLGICIAISYLCETIFINRRERLAAKKLKEQNNHPHQC